MDLTSTKSLAGSEDQMPIPFWPKFASAEDAPNYQPTAGDDRCETCSYFRALSDGSGYCERFSFQCEPASICDDFVAAGRPKTAAAPSIMSRLTDALTSPVAKRVGISAGAGGATGGAVGAYGSGEDQTREAIRGGLAGAATGATLGLLGPAVRNIKAKDVFNKQLLQEKDTLGQVVSEGKGAQNKLKFLSEKFKAAKDARKSVAERLQAASEYKEAIKPYGTGSNARKELQVMIDGAEQAKKSLEALKNKKYVPDLVQLATPGSQLEAYGVPTLSALVGGGLGFGLSHASKEQERFRKSKMK